MNKKYCNSFTELIRWQTTEVDISGLKIGGDNPVRLQTMTNTSTNNIAATVGQIILSEDAGAELVRITVPGLRDIDNIARIREELNKSGHRIPLVADIHFNHHLALKAAEIVDKVRINPGNFADSKQLKTVNYSEDDYAAELDRVRQLFLPLIDTCKKNNTAIRIGVNHGSLSDRIMSRFGDTVEGMAESAMEFLRICSEESFKNVVISMKASNTMIMVFSTRLLVAKMNMENMNYPLHLGVTEAGEGEDGRIKSAVGIGALLADGLGDTIRVSLTEPPENEIPVACKLAHYFKGKYNHRHIEAITHYPLDPYNFNRRETQSILTIGGNSAPVVIAVGKSSAGTIADTKPDFYVNGNSVFEPENSTEYTLYTNLEDCSVDNSIAFLEMYAKDINKAALPSIYNLKNKVIIIKSDNENSYMDQRAAIIRLINHGIGLPVILKREYSINEPEDFQLKSAADCGGLFIDGLADGIWLVNNGNIPDSEIVSTSFGILQASRRRYSKTEYISCPSCGRTMFNLQETTRRIREKTSHLKGLKLGVMGCIVNGLGEMADADYGYIGAGSGKVNLYHNKELIKRGIPEENAVNELVNLIKEKGDWVDPT